MSFDVKPRRSAQEQGVGGRPRAPVDVRVPARLSEFQFVVAMNRSGSRRKPGPEVRQPM